MTLSIKNLLVLGKPLRLPDVPGQNGKHEQADTDGEGTLDDEQILPSVEGLLPLKHGLDDQTRDGNRDEPHHAKHAGAKTIFLEGVCFGVAEIGSVEGVGEVGECFGKGKDLLG